MTHESLELLAAVTAAVAGVRVLVRAPVTTSTALAGAPLVAATPCNIQYTILMLLGCR
jgi:hypothetical protein